MDEMGKEARLRRKRRLARTPPPVGKTRSTTTRGIWLGTGALAAVAACVVAVLLVRGGGSSPPPPAANASALDTTAPPQLVAAANKVGFRPHTEPGVGEIESEPASAAQPPASTALLPVGSRAPGFTLSTPTGRNVTLSAERGKATLLEFFATWCPHCEAEAPHLDQLARSLGTKRYAFVSVNGDSENAASVFAYERYFGLRFPALLDPGGTPGSFDSPGSAGRVTTKYGLQAFPTFYVVAPTGKITWRSDGEQPTALLRQELERATAGAA
jgi:thiol-disulfide isomerase/thioredoxin